MSRAAVAPPVAPAGLDPRRWLVLAVVLAAPLMAIFDQFAVNVAIPTMQRDLTASFAQIQLVIAGYALAYAVLLITGGRLGDIYGRKRLFLLGLAGFTLASALCGFSPDPNLLVGARIIQGSAAALLGPQVLAIIRISFLAAEQSSAFAVYGAVLGLAGILGQVLGGLLIRANLFSLDWRPIFLVNVPIGVAAMVASALLLRESRAPLARKLDLGGVAIVSTGLFLLVFPLVIGRDAGWPAWAWLCLAVSAPILAVFVAFERWLSRQQGSPLVELGLFRSRAFSVGLLVMLVVQATGAGYFLILALYLQIGLRFTALQAGLVFTPDAAGFFLAATLSARLMPRLGRWLLNIGALTRALGLTIILVVAYRGGAGLHGYELLPGVFIQGFGAGCISAPMVGFILAGIRGGDAGSAAGVLTTVQQVAGAIGVAVIGVIFFSLLGRGADPIAAALVPTLQHDLATGTVAAPAATIDDFRICVRDRASARDPAVPPASCQRATLRPADPALAAALTSAQTTANARVYARAFALSLASIVGTLLVSCLLMLLLPVAQELRDD